MYERGSIQGIAGSQRTRQQHIYHDSSRADGPEPTFGLFSICCYAQQTDSS